jgi:hypothetical protein
MTSLARVVREDVRELLRKRPGRTPPPR